MLPVDHQKLARSRDYGDPKLAPPIQLFIFLGKFFFPLEHSNTWPNNDITDQKIEIKDASQIGILQNVPQETALCKFGENQIRFD